jgi:hypothetical protein
MKRPVRPTKTEASRRKPVWKELWKRLLTDDDLDTVVGGGSPMPITSSGTAATDDCGHG